MSRVEVAPAIAFTDPDPASPVTLDTDADGGATPDFNYDVALALAEPAPVSGVATLEIGDGVTVFNRVTARVAADDSVVLFDNASLPSGDLTLGARFVDDIGNTSVAAPATVTVDNGETVEFALSAPQNGALLANDVGFTLEYTGAVDQTGLSCQLVSIDSAGMESNVGAAQTWGDTATPLSFSQTLTEGPSTLRVDCGGSPSQVVEIVVEDDAPAAPVLANEPSDVPGFLVFDQAPGSAFVNLLSSDDSAVAGLQHNIRILVTTPEADATGWTVELTVTLPDASTVTYTRPVGVGPSATIDIPAVEFGAMDGTIVFSAVVTDSLGRTSPTTTAELVIDRTAPVLSQVTPDPSESLFTLDDDGNVSLEFVDLAFEFSGDAADDGLDVELTILPAPQDLDPAGVVLTQTLAGGAADFGLIAFTDGTDFTTTARLVDPAGNAAEVASVPFEVRLAAPRATFDIPEAPGLLTSANDVSSDAGFQGQFRVEYSGFSSGSTVRLCSTVAPPGGGLGDCALGTAETGPDVGGGSPSETGLRGVIVATGLTSGSFEAGATFFPERSLSEGEQWLHFEVEEADLDPQVASRFFRFVVDTVGPTVTAFTLDQNVTDNDPVDQVALAAAEGTVDSGRLLTNASVSVTGAEEGATVEVLSNLGGSNNVVGQGVLTGGSVTFTLSVGSGLQVLTVNVLDSAGNSNAVAGNPEAIT
ncbi:MAG: hypothetical protein AAFY60_07725, partial [Myxococcota bacterium]